MVHRSRGQLEKETVALEMFVTKMLHKEQMRRTRRQHLPQEHRLQDGFRRWQAEISGSHVGVLAEKFREKEITMTTWIVGRSKLTPAWTKEPSKRKGSSCHPGCVRRHAS